VALAISLQAALVHQEQEHLLVAVVVVQDLQVLAQTLLAERAVMAVQVAAVVVVQVLLLEVQAATALSFYTTKEF
jgi:hypothetical protein